MGYAKETSTYRTSIEEVGLLNVIRIHTGGNTDHPEELVEIITTVTNETTEDNQDVIHIEGLQNRIGLFFRRGEGLCLKEKTKRYTTDGGDVCVVPRVVIDNDSTVTHTGHLVTVIPPGEELGVLVGVHTHPVVGFTVIIHDGARAVMSCGGDDDGGRGVGFGGDEGRVHGVEQKHGIDDKEDRGKRRDGNGGNLYKWIRINKRTLLLLLDFHFLATVTNIGEETTDDTRETFGSEDTGNRSEGKHQTNHNTGEVPGDSTVEDEEDVTIRHLLEEKVNTHGSERDHDVKIQEEGSPGGGLVFGDRGNDGNVLGGVGGIEEGKGTTRPTSDTRMNRQLKAYPKTWIKTNMITTVTTTVKIKKRSFL